MDRENQIIKNVSRHSYFAVLAKEWKFWEKLYKNRVDKIKISKRIVEECINESDKVIVDSGTTIDQIPQLINERFSKNPPEALEIYTNNIISVISVIPPKIRVFLLEGAIDSIYGATYNSEDVTLPMKDLRPTKIILAATAISFENGPMVKTSDQRNIEFKKFLIKKAMLNPFCSLIIAVDWMKFRNLPQDGSLSAVIDDQNVWKNAILNQERFSIFLTEPAPNNNTIEAQTAITIIQQFIENANRPGMKVFRCNNTGVENAHNYYLHTYFISFVRRICLYRKVNRR